MTVPQSFIGRTKGLVLRREFFLPPKKWNEQALIKINSKSFGTWFIPFGSLVLDYSVKHEDFVIDLMSVLHKDSKRDLTLEIELMPQSEWNDMAYYLYAVL